MQEVFCDGWVGLYNIKTITSMESSRKDIKNKFVCVCPKPCNGEGLGKDMET